VKRPWGRAMSTSALLVFALLLSLPGCRRPRLVQCKELTIAIADGSSAAMAKSGSADQFKIALAQAADLAEKVQLDNPPHSSSRDLDLTAPRTAYVDKLRKALSEPMTPPHSDARSELLRATAQAIDAVNLLCTGER